MARFSYTIRRDTAGQKVLLIDRSLRREDTYREEKAPPRLVGG
jgi:hypothetical protein